MTFVVDDIHGLVASAAALRKNWDKTKQNSEAIEAVGGAIGSASLDKVDQFMNDMDKSFDAVYSSIDAKDWDGARANLEQAKQNHAKAAEAAKGYNRIKNAIAIKQGIDIADAALDPDHGADNIAEMTSLGNITSSGLKGGYKGLLSFGGSIGNKALEELTGFDVYGTIDQGIDVVGDTVQKIPGADMIKKGVRNSLGLGIQGLANIPVGSKYERWRDARGNLHKNEADAQAVNDKLYGEEGHTPEYITEDMRLGGQLTDVTGEIGEATDTIGSIFNPLGGEAKLLKPTTWFSNMRNALRETKEGIAQRKEREQMFKDWGYSTWDTTRWTDEDWALDRLYSAQAKQPWEDMNAQYEMEKDMNFHIAQVHGLPIRLQTHHGAEKNADGKWMEQPFNSNWSQDDMDNIWYDIDPIAEGFFDDNGRPTPRLLNYAKALDRPIELYDHGEWNLRYQDGGVEPIRTLDPTGEDYFYEAGQYFRGIEAPQIQEATSPFLENFETFESLNEDDDSKFMYNFDNSNYYRDDDGEMWFAGTYQMDLDPEDMGNGWFDDEWGYEYRMAQKEGASGFWKYDSEGGWLYEAENDAGSTWIWNEDVGWLYPHISEETGEKWVWSHELEDWGHWETNRGKESDEWIWQNTKPVIEQQQEEVAQEEEQDPYTREDAENEVIAVVAERLGKTEDEVRSILNQEPQTEREAYMEWLDGKLFGSVNKQAEVNAVMSLYDTRGLEEANKNFWSIYDTKAGTTLGNADRLVKQIMGVSRQPLQNLTDGQSDDYFNYSAHAAHQQSMTQWNNAVTNHFNLQQTHRQDIKSQQPNINLNINTNTGGNTGVGTSGGFNLNTGSGGGNIGTGTSGGFNLNTQGGSSNSFWGDVT